MVRSRVIFLTEFGISYVKIRYGRERRSKEKIEIDSEQSKIFKNPCKFHKAFYLDVILI